MLSEKIENTVAQADVLMRGGQMTALLWLHFMAELAAFAEDVRELERNCAPINTNNPNIIPFRPRLHVVHGGDAA